METHNSFFARDTSYSISYFVSDPHQLEVESDSFLSQYIDDNYERWLEDRGYGPEYALEAFEWAIIERIDLFLVHLQGYPVKRLLYSTNGWYLEFVPGTCLWAHNADSQVLNHSFNDPGLCLMSADFSLDQAITPDTTIAVVNLN